MFNKIIHTQLCIYTRIDTNTHREKKIYYERAIERNQKNKYNNKKYSYS